MDRLKSILLNVIFFFQVLLLFLLIFQDRVTLPIGLQVLGRLHPAVLHLPIGLLFFFVIFLLFRKEFESSAFRKICLFILILISFTATVTALFGFFLSRQGDYGGDTLFQHKVTGTLLSLFCYALLVLFDKKEKAGVWFYALGGLSIVLLVMAGHSGATLTHGENFVFAPLEKQNAVKDETIFSKAVFPILEKKCISCHNPSKAKGNFVMTSIDEFKKGGENGIEWENGKPDSSRLIQYIRLPLTDDNHMPPDGKPQLTDHEIKILEQWISSGGDFSKKPGDLANDDPLQALIGSNPVTEHAKVYAFQKASDETIKKLNTPFRAVFPLFRESPALQADFFIKESFEPKSLEELDAVREQLVVLNLSAMPVTDASLAIVGKFVNLEKVNLNFSKIDGSGLTKLMDLKNLSSLSISGTAVTVDQIKPVLSLPALRELYVWSTGVTEEEIVPLRKQYPNLAIITSQFVDDKVLKLGKPILENEGLVKKGEKVVLKHSMPGVVMRYTLDGSAPDSTQSVRYDEPLSLTRTSKVKAIVCKEGWYCSDVFEMTCFMEGYKPVKTELLSQTVKYYSGQGSVSLTDGWKGFVEVLNTPFWLGFRETSLEAGFDFGEHPPEVKSIVISYAKNLYSSGFPPKEVEVWAGKNAKDLKLVSSMKVKLPSGYESSQVEALSIPVSGDRYSYYKLVARPVDKLPVWHSEKGKKGLLLVDEILFY